MKISGAREPHDTPCKGICSASAFGDAICRGCGRTREEVDGWNTLTIEQKIKINERIKHATNEPDPRTL